MNSLEQEIAQICTDMCECKITPQTLLRSIEDWDSMMQINLVVALESKYNIKFALNELGILDSPATCAKIIANKK